jgi:hypothetical protein
MTDHDLDERHHHRGIPGPVIPCRENSPYAPNTDAPPWSAQADAMTTPSHPGQPATDAPNSHATGAHSAPASSDATTTVASNADCQPPTSTTSTIATTTTRRTSNRSAPTATEPRRSTKQHAHDNEDEVDLAYLFTIANGRRPCLAGSHLRPPVPRPPPGAVKMEGRRTLGGGLAPRTDRARRPVSAAGACRRMDRQVLRSGPRDG